MLCRLFYDEIRFICDQKLSVPRDLDEFYLGLFREQYKEHIHLVEMDMKINILIFYDNEDLDEKIRQTGERLFMQPYKSQGRANKTMVTNVSGNQQECIVNIAEQYIFNNWNYDFGRLLKLDDVHYRILWSKQPERREILNMEILKIRKQPAGFDSAQTSPVISVVMPTYNTPQEYLRESVESILKQTFADFELLIIDDGSTETQGIEWLETLQDTRIRLIRNPHDFIDSLNRGVAESRGKYIARMDADDVAMPNRLQRQYDFMEEHPEIDVCGLWMEQFGIKNETVRTLTEHKEIVSSLLLYNTIAHPTVILRKVSVCGNETNLYKKGYNYAEDYKLWTDLGMRKLRFANIPEVLLKYRNWGNQITSVKQKEMYQSSLKIRMEYGEEIMKQIVKKEERLFDFFEQLVKLFNDNLIALNDLLNIVYQIHYNNIHK